MVSGKERERRHEGHTTLECSCSWGDDQATVSLKVYEQREAITCELHEANPVGSGHRTLGSVRRLSIRAHGHRNLQGGSEHVVCVFFQLFIYCQQQQSPGVRCGHLPLQG